MTPHVQTPAVPDTAQRGHGTVGPVVGPRCDLRVVYRAYDGSYLQVGTCCHPRLHSSCDLKTLAACGHRTRLSAVKPIPADGIIRLNPLSDRPNARLDRQEEAR